MFTVHAYFEHCIAAILRQLLLFSCSRHSPTGTILVSMHIFFNSASLLRLLNTSFLKPIAHVYLPFLTVIPPRTDSSSFRTHLFHPSTSLTTFLYYFVHHLCITMSALFCSKLPENYIAISSTFQSHKSILFRSVHSLSIRPAFHYHCLNC